MSSGGSSFIADDDGAWSDDDGEYSPSDESEEEEQTTMGKRSTTRKGTAKHNTTSQKLRRATTRTTRASVETTRDKTCTTKKMWGSDMESSSSEESGSTEEGERRPRKKRQRSVLKEDLLESNDGEESDDSTEKKHKDPRNSQDERSILQDPVDRDVDYSEESDSTVEKETRSRNPRSKRSVEDLVDPNNGDTEESDSSVGEKEKLQRKPQGRRSLLQDPHDSAHGDSDASDSSAEEKEKCASKPQDKRFVLRDLVDGDDDESEKSGCIGETEDRQLNPHDKRSVLKDQVGSGDDDWEESDSTREKEERPRKHQNIRSVLKDQVESNDDDSSKDLVDTEDEDGSEAVIQGEWHKERSTKRLRLDRERSQVKRELRELQEYQQFCEEPKKASNSRNSEESSSDDSSVFELAIEPLCDKCPDEVLMIERHRNKDGKLFFSCPKCNNFMWPKEAYNNLPEGPHCHCMRPSYPQLIADNEEGESSVWRCVNTDGQKGCDFELPIADTFRERVEQLNMSQKLCADKTNSWDEQYLVGARTKNLLQKLFHLSYDESKTVRSGSAPGGYADYFQVHRAWRVDIPQSQADAFKDFRATQEGCAIRTVLRPSHQQAMGELLQEDGNLEPLNKAANEVLLLHGTKPEVVASILEKSLDTEMANAGLFGRGTYFAEHPSKIDQYTTLDTSWVGNRRHPLRETHKKLYPCPDIHGGNIFYALVCRVVLGAPDATQDTRRSKPQQGYHSIVAERGNGSHPCFREFIVFDKRSVKIEYVVAYKQVKHYCGCGTPVRERTMEEYGKDRPIISCDNSFRSDGGRWQGGCGLFAKLPRCYCRNHGSGGDFYGAKAKLSQRMYSCERCSFREPMDQGGAIQNDEDDDEGDEWYEYDDFVVEG